MKKKQIIMAAIIFIGGVILSLYLARELDGLLNGQGLLPYQVSIIEVFHYTIDNEAPRMVFLMLSAIALFGAVAFLFSSGKPYQSNTNKITPDIETPVIAGQNQHGSARWLKEEGKDQAFDTFILDSNKESLLKLFESGETDRQCVKDGEMWRKEKQYIYKNVATSGGLVLGKKNIGKKHGIKRKSGKDIEKIYFVGNDSHSLTIGSTGSSKSRSVVLQTIGLLALARESMVVSDIKGELHNYGGSFLKKCGFNVYTLDFKNPLKSHCYNFLQPIIDAINAGQISQAVDFTWDLTGALVGETKGEPIWENGETSIIAACIMLVVVENKDVPEYQNLTNVFYFIAKMCKAQKKEAELPLVKYMKRLEGDYPNHPALGLVAISDIAPSRTQGSFFTSALGTLKLFTNPMIYAMTKKSDFNPKDIGKKPTAVFMILPDGKTTYYSIASLFCTQNYNTLSEVADSFGGRLPVRTNFILDEFGNFTTIPFFSNQLTAGRSKGIRFNLFLQSLAQLEEKYGKEVARTIRGNCETWIYLQADDSETLKEISEKLGKYTTTSYSISASQQRYASASSSQSVNLIGRELLMTNEVKKIKRPYSLVTSLNDPAIMTAPDLSQWLFNDLFSLGNEKHNTQLRIMRESAREEKAEEEIKLWGIWNAFTY
jgi:type IV secretion system protein VirD4